jgi:hypothetical protein
MTTGRVLFSVLLAGALAATACKKKEEAEELPTPLPSTAPVQPAAPAPTPEPAPVATAEAQEIPTAEDFEEEAAEDITPNNMEDELDKLEKEITAG